MTLESPARLLDRFHGVLLAEIRERRPEYLSDSFTVAEIYQHLVPYASHRDRLGVEMNGDYEDVLLRLLAGEGDYLALESEPARERLRKELDSPNPDTSMYREYAAAHVHLNPDCIDRDAEDPDGEDAPAAAVPDAATEGTVSDDPVRISSSGGEEITPSAEREADSTPEEELAAPAEEGAPPADRESGADEAVSPVEGHPEPSPDHPAVPSEAPAATAKSVRPEEPDTAAESFDGTCSWCREELPERENLHFCPFCGTDVRLVPCPSCGEALEPRWRFCIACGTGVTGA